MALLSNFFDCKTKEKRQTEKTGYAMSILLPNEENKVCLVKIGRLVVCTHARMHTHIQTRILDHKS